MIDAMMASDLSGTKQKITERTYKEKMTIIQYKELKPSFKQKLVTAHFGISKSALTGILKAKDRIIAT